MINDHRGKDRRDSRRSPDRAENRRSSQRGDRRQKPTEERDWRSAKVGWARVERRDGRRRERSPYSYRRQTDRTEAERVLVTQPVQEKEDLCDMGCFEKHRLRDCPEFGKLTHPEKNKIASEKRRCYSCLGVGHQACCCKTKAGKQA